MKFTLLLSMASLLSMAPAHAVAKKAPVKSLTHAEGTKRNNIGPRRQLPNEAAAPALEDAEKALCKLNIGTLSRDDEANKAKIQATLMFPKYKNVTVPNRRSGFVVYSYPRVELKDRQREYAIYTVQTWDEKNKRVKSYRLLFDNNGQVDKKDSGRCINYRYKVAGGTNNTCYSLAETNQEEQEVLFEEFCE